MIVSEPKIDQRKEQPYVGIRKSVPMSDLPNFIPQNLQALYGWLRTKGIAPDGPSFMRYYAIEMPGRLDVEVGIPVAQPVTGDDTVKSGSLPAGRYASLVYRDVTKGMEGNKVLIEWAQEKGLSWDRWDDPNGDAFASRYEIFLTGPDEDPSPNNWDTEVAIKLKD